MATMRVAAAAFVMALVGCGGAEKREAPAGGQEMRNDQPSAADLDWAAEEFGKKLHEEAAKGFAIHTVAIAPVKNGIDPSFDPMPLQRRVVEQLTSSGLEVAGAGAKADGQVTIDLSREEVAKDSYSFQIHVTLAQGSDGHPIVSTSSRFSKMSDEAGQ